MTDTAENTISTLVQGVAEELDLPKGLRLAAEQEYSELGAWMSRSCQSGTAIVAQLSASVDEPVPIQLQIFRQPA